jgi:hypothetical protein
MIAGKCDAGKELARKSFEANHASIGEETTVENAVEGYVSLFCQGGNMTPRDQLLKALRDLQDGAYVAKKDKAMCLSAYQTVKKLAPQVKPKDQDDIVILQGPMNLYATAPNCIARAGDCDGAFKVFNEAYTEDRPHADPKIRDESRKRLFETLVKRCKK